MKGLRVIALLAIMFAVGSLFAETDMFAVAEADTSIVRAPVIYPK